MTYMCNLLSWITKEDNWMKCTTTHTDTYRLHFVELTCLINSSASLSWSCRHFSSSQRKNLWNKNRKHFVMSVNSPHSNQIRFPSEIQSISFFSMCPCSCQPGNFTHMFCMLIILVSKMTNCSMKIVWKTATALWSQYTWPFKSLGSVRFNTFFSNDALYWSKWQESNISKD